MYSDASPSMLGSAIDLIADSDILPDYLQQSLQGLSANVQCRLHDVILRLEMI